MVRSASDSSDQLLPLARITRTRGRLRVEAPVKASTLRATMLPVAFLLTIVGMAGFFLPAAASLGQLLTTTVRSL